MYNKNKQTSFAVLVAQKGVGDCDDTVTGVVVGVGFVMADVGCCILVLGLLLDVDRKLLVEMLFFCIE